MPTIKPSNATAFDNDDTTLFATNAARYEAWYESPEGLRADLAEKRLLARLLQCFDTTGRILEIGSGTGHFTEWLDELGRSVIGIDRSWAMLSEHRRLARAAPVVLADAHALPIRSGAIAITVLITTLEFLRDPLRALRECVRTSTQGVVVLALNRHSIGALRRRRRGGSILSAAHDLTRAEVTAWVKTAAGPRLRAVQVRSSLFPRPFHTVRSSLPIGDVIGVAATLDPDPDIDTY